MARNKQPTALAEFTGATARNPKRYAGRSSCKGVQLQISKPAFINSETSSAWDSIVPGLEALGVISIVDVPSLLAMFDHYEKYANVRKLLTEFDAEYCRKLETFTDMQLVNQRKSMASQLSLHWNDFSKIASRFGLTPSDREKISITEQKDADPLDIVLGY